MIQLAWHAQRTPNPKQSCAHARVHCVLHHRLHCCCLLALRWQVTILQSRLQPLASPVSLNQSSTLSSAAHTF